MYVLMFFFQLESYLMHPALMEQYDSTMDTSQKRAGWRSASTMPGALCVMMDGTTQMLQLSAGNWGTTRLVCSINIATFTLT